MEQPVYSPDTKLMVVEEYLNTNIGYKPLAKKYGMDSKTIRDWVKRFEEFGTDYFYNPQNYEIDFPPRKKPSIPPGEKLNYKPEERRAILERLKREEKNRGIEI